MALATYGGTAAVLAYYQYALQRSGVIVPKFTFLRVDLTSVFLSGP